MPTLAKNLGRTWRWLKDPRGLIDDLTWQQAMWIFAGIVALVAAGVIYAALTGVFQGWSQAMQNIF